MERCPSGLRSWSWKPVTPQGAVGSNPTFSAVSTGILIEYRLLVSLFGEVPKRLKGLPWKGSRSLIAARGFKSLLLRCTGLTVLFFRLFIGNGWRVRVQMIRTKKNKKRCWQLSNQMILCTSCRVRLGDRSAGQQKIYNRKYALQIFYYHELKKFLTNANSFDNI